MSYYDDSPIRPLELEPAEGYVAPVEAPPVNPEPEVRVRPLELEAASVDKARVAHGVRHEGRGMSDQYCTADVAIRSAAEARRLFGLDWTVSKVPLFAEVGGRRVEVTDKRAIVRDDTGDVLGVVGDRYAVMQNDVLDLLDAITDQAPIVRGGVWDGGRRVWLQTAVTTFDTPSGPCEGNGLAATSHDGSLALSFTRLGNVVVCRNTFRLNLAKSPSAVTIRHTKGAAKAIEQIKRALDESRVHFRQVSETMMTWGRTKISSADLNRFVEAMFPKSEKCNTRRDERVAQFMHAYEKGPGAMPGTAWGLAMATTYYQEHMRAIREGTDRFERAFSDSWTQEAFAYVHVIAGTR